MRTSERSDPLTLAFPAELAADAEAALSVMPPPHFLLEERVSVVVQGQRVAIPRRLYRDEPESDAVASLSPRRRQLLHCLYSRHCDGVVRQRHLEQIIGSTDPWTVPFVVQLVGEYVVEILVVIRDQLRDRVTPGSRGHHAYGRFIVDNPAYFNRTQRRVVSYWHCYHRISHPRLRDYPGRAVLDLLRSAAADTAGHPWPDVAPVAGKALGRR